MAEMTFLESFRYIDTYTEAVIKLQEAAHTISRHGADLKEWEATGEVVKKKIQKEIAVLTNERDVERRKGIIQKDSLLEQGIKAKEQIEPTFVKLREAQERLEKVSKELSETLEAKDFTIRAATAERDRILKEGYDKARIVSSEIEGKRLKSEERLVEVETKIKQLKDNLASL